MCYPPQDYVGTIPGLHAPTHGVAGVDPVALDASQTNTGRFGLARIPDAAAGNFLEGGGVGLNPVYNPLVAADIPNLDTAKITTGRFGMPRMPDGVLGNVLTAQGAGVDPVYAAPGAGVDTRSRTIVVAASNSIDPTLAPAAYRCDGVADQVEINNAITALGAIGGTVILLEGTYNTTASITITRSNVTLMGMGHGTIIDVAGAAVHGIVVGNGATHYENVIIQDLKVDGTHATGVSYGIYVWGPAANEITNVRIVRCWVYDFPSRNIFFSNVNHSSILLCRSEVDGTGIYLSTCDYNTIYGNHLLSSDAEGIYLTASQFNRIFGNYVSLNSLDGISLAGDSNYSVVANNQCFDNGQDGIHHSTCCYSVIHGNVCRGNGLSNIHLDGDTWWNTVTANVCLLADTLDGIRLEGNSDDTVIIGNELVSNDDYGVRILDATCDRNTVKNNSYVNNTLGPISDNGTGTRLAEVQVPITQGTLSNIGDFLSVLMTDGSDVTTRFNFRVPSDFHQLVRARVVVVPLGTGDLRRGVETDFGACAEVYTTHSDSIAAGQVAVTINQLTCLDINAALDGIAAGDHVGVAFTRYGSDVLDTVNANVHVIMFWMQYV